MNKGLMLGIGIGAVLLGVSILGYGLRAVDTGEWSWQKQNAVAAQRHESAARQRKELDSLCMELTRLADRDRNGVLNIAEYTEAMRRCGLNTSSYENIPRIREGGISFEFGYYPPTPDQLKIGIASYRN